MPTFRERVDQACTAARSLLCVGLDPDPALMPVRDIFTFNREIVDATHDLVCAYKPQLAFYEAQGISGWQALERTVHHIRSAAPHAVVLADAKRGDVPNTAKAYARALFETWDFDAATVNPYPGRDAVEPFLAYQQKGVFLVCRTSNPGSADFQDVVVGGGEDSRPLYELVAARAQEWDRHGNMGLVMGATFPAELGRVRALCPQMPILVPGIGPQEGDMEASVRLGMDARGRAALINASRSVLYASNGADFGRAAREAATRLRDAINAVLQAEGHGWS